MTLYTLAHIHGNQIRQLCGWFATLDKPASWWKRERDARGGVVKVMDKGRFDAIAAAMGRKG